ncbi:MAG: hypothetical protein QOF76_5078 [Solirubrobacteraceae bacterium]|nr:hypothetical protein [Solirubrobacteraceae bacterium]
MPAPGIEHERPQRFRPRFHWELLSCGVDGHRLEGMDARTIRPEDAIFAREEEGTRWYRCLRCDSWLPLPPPETPTRDTPPPRESIDLPLRGRPLRDKIILRLIAVNRALHFLGLGLVAIIILLFSANREDLRATALKVIADLGGGTAADAGHHHHGLAGEIDKLFSLRSSKLHLFAAIAGLYAIVEGVEAIGLWYAKRWAEYLTLIVTASLLPLEVYEISHKVSPFKIFAFVLNVAVVAYLLYAKRLFGIRGGVAAEHALKERDVGWHALEAATPVRSAP